MLGEHRVLLTGATGFVGSHLARSLVAHGTHVTALVRPGTTVVPDGVVPVEIPVSAVGLEEAVASSRPDVCIHLATRFIVRHRPEDLVDLLEANVVLGARLAEALVAAGPVPLIDTGTVWQHVDGAAFRPANLYAASKQALGDLLVAYALRDALPVVRVTLTDTYGPGDRRPKLVPLLVRAARTGEVVKLSSGHQLVDLVHVADVVAGLESVAERLVGAGERWEAPEDGIVGYGLSAGETPSVRELVDIIDRLTDRPLAVRWGARPDRPVEMRRPWPVGPPPVDWQPRIALDGGLAQLLRPEPHDEPPTTMS